jgi:hypothetical protein
VDIWQALTYEQCRAMVALSKISQNGSETANDIVSDIANTFRKIIPTRNHLIHGTWQISRKPPEGIPTKLVEKYKVTKQGLERRDDLPSSFEEIVALTERNKKNAWTAGKVPAIFYIRSDENRDGFR